MMVSALMVGRRRSYRSAAVLDVQLGLKLHPARAQRRFLMMLLLRLLLLLLHRPAQARQIRVRLRVA